MEEDAYLFDEELLIQMEIKGLAAEEDVANGESDMAAAAINQHIECENDDEEVWYYSSDSETENDREQVNDNENDNAFNGKNNELSTVNRMHLTNKLLAAATNWVLPRGIVKQLSLEFHVHRTTLYRLWKSVKQQSINSEIISVASNRTGKCGRKPKITEDEQLMAIPLKQRTTLRSFAAALEVSPSTVYRLLKRGILRAHTNSIKPKLNPKHKIARLQFILARIISRSVTELPKFSNLSNVVHIDEKWFFMSKTTQRFYLLAEEEEPYRCVQSKNFINKVMFLSGIAQPVLREGGVIWDGKIGIFPFTELYEAQRWSKNMDKGTIETKALQSITKEVIRHMIINQLLPAIRAKWPIFGSRTIWIQQDNARPHIQPNDELFLQEATKDGFDIHLICQPAQSPDLNMLDLRFFRAIQSIQHQQFPTTIDELIKSVKDAYEAYDPKLINYTWLQLRYIMLEILRVSGGNNYKSPHKGKKRLDNMGLLPTDVEVPQNLIDRAVEVLNEGLVNVSSQATQDSQFDGI